MPPLAEQKRIAALLDQPDAIRRRHQEGVQLADQTLRALSQKAFAGQL